MNDAFLPQTSFHGIKRAQNINGEETHTAHEYAITLISAFLWRMCIDVYINGCIVLSSAMIHLNINKVILLLYKLYYYYI